MAGAGLGALSHALSKVVLFGAVGVAEARIGKSVTLDTRGLAARLPIAGAAFIAAALSFIGVPPGFGFVGYWRIYVAATQFGGLALIIALLAVAALDLLCYARAIHRTWLGSPQIQVDWRPGVSGGECGREPRRHRRAARMLSECRDGSRRARAAGIGAIGEKAE